MKQFMYAMFFVLLLSFATQEAFGQQFSISKNNSFRAGEELFFDMYFKYGIFYTKAGNSSLSVSNSQFSGDDAYKLQLLAESSGAVSKIFILNDTIVSYITKDLIPLAAFKNAREGKDYTVEETYYSYVGDNTSIRVKRVKNGSFRFDKTLSSQKIVYDYLSAVYYARTLDFSKIKKGDKVPIDFISGDKKIDMHIIHQGIETIKANDGIKYACIKLQLSIVDNAFENAKEAMRVYLTNDENKMPIRIESKLKVGETRAILRSYKGNLHPIK